MAAAVKLLLSEVPNTAVCYSGNWRTIDDSHSHVLHWSRCNLHAAQIDPTIDCSSKHGNYYTTRVRSLFLSDDANELNLMQADGIKLHWQRAPNHGWSLSEVSSAPSVDALFATLLRSVPASEKNSSVAIRMYKANLLMFGLIAGFIEPREAAMMNLARSSSDDEGVVEENAP